MAFTDTTSESPGGLVGSRIAGSPPQGSTPFFWEGPGVCIPDRCPGSWDAAGSRSASLRSPAPAASVWTPAHHTPDLGSVSPWGKLEGHSSCCSQCLTHIVAALGGLPHTRWGPRTPMLFPWNSKPTSDTSLHRHPLPHYCPVFVSLWHSVFPPSAVPLQSQGLFFSCLFPYDLCLNHRQPGPGGLLLLVLGVWVYSQSGKETTWEESVGLVLFEADWWLWHKESGDTWDFRSQDGPYTVGTSWESLWLNPRKCSFCGSCFPRF